MSEGNGRKTPLDRALSMVTAIGAVVGVIVGYTNVSRNAADAKASVDAMRDIPARVHSLEKTAEKLEPVPGDVREIKTKLDMLIEDRKRSGKDGANG